jgi:hypothetical protein
MEKRMAMSCKLERSLVNHGEQGVILNSHHPEIYALDLAGLKTLQGQLRQMRDKERSLARHKQRERRGKAEPRGGSFPGTVEQPQKRKQIFASALKRVNKEVQRAHNLEARAANIEAARRALEMRRAANFRTYPASGDTPNPGMISRPSRRRMTKVSGKRIGSVSQATKVAQARRDSR